MDWDDIFFEDGKAKPVMLLKGDFGEHREEVESLQREMGTLDAQISALQRELESPSQRSNETFLHTLKDQEISQEHRVILISL